MNIEQLKTQLKQCIQQRDEYASMFQQAIGAINLLQEQIKMLMVAEALEKKKAEEQAKAAAEAEAKKQADLVDMDIAKLDHDIKLDEGVLQNEG